jgi:hypothetical protein
MQHPANELLRKPQPVEKVVIQPVGTPNRVQKPRNHDQNTAIAGRRVRKRSSEGDMEEFFNRLTPSTHSGE